MLVKTQQCPHYQSSNIVKNGRTRHANQRVKCRDCGKTRVLNPKKSPFIGQPWNDRSANG